MVSFSPARIKGVMKMNPEIGLEMLFAQQLLTGGTVEPCVDLITMTNSYIQVYHKTPNGETKNNGFFHIGFLFLASKMIQARKDLVDAVFHPSPFHIPTNFMVKICPLNVHGEDQDFYTRLVNSFDYNFVAKVDRVHETAEANTVCLTEDADLHLVMDLWHLLMIKLNRSAKFTLLKKE